MSTNQLSYISKYNKKNYKMYQFRVKKSDIEMIQKLDSMYNRTAYITNLISENIRPNVLTIKQIKERIKPIMDKHGIEEVYLFGSYARGEANSNSDVDIYCSTGDLKTFANDIDFEEELEDALGKKVDIVTIGSEMHWYFRQQLEKDLIKLCLL